MVIWSAFTMRMVTLGIHSCSPSGFDRRIKNNKITIVCIPCYGLSKPKIPVVIYVCVNECRSKLT